MSLSEFQRFNQDLLNNEKMLEQVQKLGPNAEAIVAFANKNGYSFTVEDLKEIEKKSSELDIETLENVSGGAGVHCDTRVVFLVTSVTAIGIVAVINEN